MPESFSIEDAKKTLQKYWNFPEFRSKQQEVVIRLAEGRNIIALLPTGGGKSICYQVPAILLPGLTVVVSPLISLMEDQVTDLKARGVRADAIHSGHTSHNIDRILDNCIYGDTKLLYISPERLHHPLFNERVLRMNISMIAIDEAHCISQWGHDFRPSYLEIKKFIDLVHPKYIIALTATATDKVIKEMKTLIFDKNPEVVKGSFVRENISISVLETEDKIGKIINSCQDRKKSIIYVRSRRQVQMISKTLSNHDIAAAYYHAGLGFKEKSKIQEEFKNETLLVVVATNAFGMGIDIPNIRRVIHYDIPPSVEEYYQEIGRAGRDGNESEAILLLSKDDVRYRAKRVKEDFPPFDFAIKLYKSVHVYFNIGLFEGEGFVKPLKYKKFGEAINLSNKKLVHGLNLWQKLGAWEISEDFKNRFYCKISLSPFEVRKEEYRLTEHYFILEYLMRHYEYIFSGWIQLDIEKDARKLQLSNTVFKEKLEYLFHRNFIKLFKLEAGPKISFLKNRISNQYLQSYELKYHQLKELNELRWKGILGMMVTSDCRMKYILEFFGETTLNRCGKCDQCISTGNNKTIEQNIKLQRKINEGLFDAKSRNDN